MTTQLTHSLPLLQFLEAVRGRVTDTLQQLLQDKVPPGELREAMEYATLNGGKRIRPVLTYSAALAVNGDLEKADSAAAAVELIHCYSLVHDDLPAMDNDDLRRGKPTLHKAFDEATAILVGDGLQTLAFEILAEARHDSNSLAQLQMISSLAMAAGARGMVGGQAQDSAAVGKILSIKALQTMHRAKTGALITASIELGALTAAELPAQTLAVLRNFASHIGLAFQIQDDILDVTADTSILGKPQGSDANCDKPTFVSLLGLDGAREQAEDELHKALAVLKEFPDQASKLRELAGYIVNRAH